ncbi:hypothetical protein GCM10027217_09200 [Pseudomaricurvus hydrocarbonicus]
MKKRTIEWTNRLRRRVKHPKKEEESRPVTANRDGLPAEQDLKAMPMDNSRKVRPAEKVQRG